MKFATPQCCHSFGIGNSESRGILRMGSMTKTISILALAVALSACTNMNVFKDSQAPQSADLAPTPEPMPMTPSVVSAAQIKTLLSGKSWRWVGAKVSGVTLYASDGTSLVEIIGKGTTGGKWSAKDGQLCESFQPLAGILPQGQPMTCRAFTGSGGVYKVGSATFTLAS
jgi:Protein of unknown function (DUF995)